MYVCILYLSQDFQVKANTLVIYLRETFTLQVKNVHITFRAYSGFLKGFLLVVDPQCRGLGAEFPAADKLYFVLDFLLLHNYHFPSKVEHGNLNIIIYNLNLG